MMSMNLKTVGVHGRAERTPPGDPFPLPEQNLMHDNLMFPIANPQRMQCKSLMCCIFVCLPPSAVA